MKRVLITGSGSFVGNSVIKHLNQWPDRYQIQTVGTMNDEWKDLSFSGFHVIFHVAGIAHVDVVNVTEQIRNEYYAVNTNLAISVAKKAKAEGVQQFIFMSSSSVYGDSLPIGEEMIITRETPITPANCYGDSKAKAEMGLLSLSSDSFRVVILRCPMIYGKGGKGNFARLEKLALKLPVFPKVENKRSMLYAGNLAEFVRLMIDNDESGIYWPCNKECANTSELVRMIAEAHGKKVFLIPGFKWALKLMSCFTKYVNKAFGSFSYLDGLGEYKVDYRLYSLAESIKETER